MKAFKLTPAFTDYLWGGTRLRDEFGKDCSYDKVAESWELSCHPDGQSVIATGPDTGMKLGDYLEREGRRVWGSHCDSFDRFPILIKLIDAQDNLSVQVHPDDEYGLRVEGEYGKTEMWYVVDCDPGASLIYGFQKEITKEEFRSRIADNTLLEVVNTVPVHPGDTFFIEAGTLHAIGAGILIAEIQQNSNTTYRVYDFGRVGADGKPRTLHIDKAVDVTRLGPPQRPVGAQEKPVAGEGYTSALLAGCPNFTVKELTLSGHFDGCADETSFHTILSLAEELVLEMEGERLPLKRGETVFIPASSGSYRLTGSGKALLTTI